LLSLSNFNKNSKTLKLKLLITSFVFFIAILPLAVSGQDKADIIRMDFYGDTIEIPISSSVKISAFSTLSDTSVQLFYTLLNNPGYQSLINSLLFYKRHYKLDDWLYYQLVRSTAERISPKLENYQRYTLYKWFFLVKSGYESFVTISNDKLLLYVQSDDEVFNIPYRLKDGKQYVCLNYHDYHFIDFDKEKFTAVNISLPGAKKAFSYKVNSLPDFKPENYAVKELQFDYYQTDYHFKIMLNKQIKNIFKNYPVVDYATYFNIPLSKITYSSLIPLLRKNVENMNQKNGVDYLMRFTRYAFGFETDTENFGAEKRLSPEQTLLYDNSDCEDRAALFFYLVKELYNLPMIVLSYPQHITIAVEFDKPFSNPIVYKGNNYWVCEPTPQRKDLRIGQGLPSLRKVPYDVVYAYNPTVQLP
jgi:hypothetical protein